jgi:hypothetical protein
LAHASAGEAVDFPHEQVSDYARAQGCQGGVKALSLYVLEPGAASVNVHGSDLQPVAGRPGAAVGLLALYGGLTLTVEREAEVEVC